MQNYSDHLVHADPTRLREHLRQCALVRSPLHRLQCAADALEAFLAPRFVTSLVLITALVLVGVSLPV